jgi:ABC-type transporter Mla subunit MlaD
METWQIAAVVLLAVLVGAAIPVLVQLAGTLRSARAALDHTGKNLDQALAALAETLQRVDGILVRLEEGKRIEGFMDSLAGLSHSVSQVRDAVKVAAAVGAAVAPAVGAAVRAWRAPGEEGGDAPAEPAAAAEAPTPLEHKHRKEATR